MRVRTTTMPAAAATLAMAFALLLAPGAAPRAEEATGAATEKAKTEVTVLRGGAEAPADHQAVTVIRGESPVKEAPVPEEAYLPPIVTGGRNLWIYDPVEGTVTACYLRYTYYADQRVLRCVSRGNYAYALSSYAGRSFARASVFGTRAFRRGLFRARLGRAARARAPVAGAVRQQQGGVVKR